MCQPRCSAHGRTTVTAQRVAIREFAVVLGPSYATGVPDDNLSYVYVFAFFVVGAALVSGMMLPSHLLAPFKPTRE